MSLLPFLLALQTAVPLSAIPWGQSDQQRQLGLSVSDTTDGLIAQTSGEIVPYIQEVRSLPGGLDDVPVFNSNSPEIISSEDLVAKVGKNA